MGLEFSGSFSIYPTTYILGTFLSVLCYRVPKSIEDNFQRSQDLDLEKIVYLNVCYVPIS